MYKLIIQIILALLLIDGYVFAESRTPPLLQPREQDRTKSQEKTKNRVNAPNFLASPSESTHANMTEYIPCDCDHCRDKQPETGFWDKTTEDPISLFTFFLMISTIGLWVAAIRQARISRQALTTSERAWVGVGFERPYVLGHNCVDLRIFNCGKSIGHIKDIQMFGFEVVDKDTPIPDNPKSVHPHGKGVWSIFPGESTFQLWNVQINEKEITEVAAKTKLLLIHGYIRYVDIFGNEHITKFYRVWMEDKGQLNGIFAIPPDAAPSQNEAT